MSLLIDALKKAEEEKKKAAEQAETPQPNPLGQSNSLPPSEATTSGPQALEKSAAPESAATELTSESPLSKDAGYVPEPQELGLATEVTQSLHSGEVSLGGPQDPTLGTSLQRPLPEDKEATLPSKRAVKSSLKEYFDSSQSLEQRRVEESDASGIRDSTLGTGPQVLLPEEKESTLPSERAIKSSLKEYFESSQSLEQRRVEVPRKPAISGATADIPTRVSAQTVFTASHRTSSARSIMLGMAAVIVLAVSLGAIWLNLHFSIPVARDVQTSAVPPMEEKPMVATESKPPVTPAIAPPQAPEPSVNPPTATVPEQPISEPAPVVRPSKPAVADVESLATSPEPAAPEEPEPEVPELAGQETVSPAPAPTVKPQGPSRPLMVAQTSQGVAYLQSLETTEPLLGPGTIKIRRSVSRDMTSTKLSEAYQAFRTGNTVRAESSYRLVLSQHPDNRDALLGLAAVAVRKGNIHEAYRLYKRLLRLNPRDSVASAALFSLPGAAGREITESQIKLLLDQTPNAPYLYFSLGNFYARQARWNEAQQAYFRAYTYDKYNPDYVFNLAVSLDRLGQGKTALTYYRQALELADQRPVNFNTSQVLARIQALSNFVTASRS